MRKFILFMLMMATTMVVFSQKKGDYLACTGNNVNVRVGPGKNYKVLTDYNGDKVQLMKGDGVGTGYVKCDHETGNYVLEYEGIRKNGFMQVSYLGEGADIHGWVSEQYLKKVCRWCDGYPETYDDCDKDNPRLLRVCKKCHGRGY